MSFVVFLTKYVKDNLFLTFIAVYVSDLPFYSKVIKIIIEGKRIFGMMNLMSLDSLVNVVSDLLVSVFITKVQ